MVDDQPDASMPTNLEARKADQSLGGRDRFERGRCPKPVLDFLQPSWWDERKQRYTVLTIFGLAHAE